MRELQHSNQIVVPSGYGVPRGIQDSSAFKEAGGEFSLRRGGCICCGTKYPVHLSSVGLSGQQQPGPLRS